MKNVTASLMMLFASWLTVPTMGEESAKTGNAVEFRLAENEAAEGLIRMTVGNTNRSVFVHPDSVLSMEDVASVCFDTSVAGNVSIALKMTDEGARKLSAASKAHLRKPIAIIVQGKVVSAPTVQGEMSDVARIDGRFSNPELKELFAALVLCEPPDGDE